MQTASSVDNTGGNTELAGFAPEQLEPPRFPLLVHLLAAEKLQLVELEAAVDIIAAGPAVAVVKLPVPPVAVLIALLADAQVQLF